mgnify:CR=1 FL=1
MKNRQVLPCTSNAKGGLRSLLGAAVFGAAIVMALPVASTVEQQLVGKTSFAGTTVLAKDEKPQPPTRKTPAIRAKVFKELEKAQLASEEAGELMKTNKAAARAKYKEALGYLDALESKGGKRALNEYELANLYNMYAFIYFVQEDYAKAKKAYQNVLAQSPKIPYAMEVNTLYTIAQLEFVAENWNSGVKQLTKWMKAKNDLGEKIGANAHALMAQGYYQQKKYRSALKEIELAVNDYKSRGKVPKEPWYGLQRFLYYELKNYKKVASLLEETLAYYQKKAYWLQLSAMYSELDQGDKMLAAYEAAYIQGLLEKEKEVVNMAYIFLANETPYKAAKTMYLGMKRKQVKPTSKNLEVMGNSWRQAQETKKAIPILAKAAQRSKDGELWARLGNVYMDSDQPKKAAAAIYRGLKKGGIKRPENAYLTLGMAEFNLKRFDKSQAAFERAAKYKKTKKFADNWLKYLAKEKARQEGLAAG